jgi:hypothetical protein
MMSASRKSITIATMRTDTSFAIQAAAIHSAGLNGRAKCGGLRNNNDDTCLGFSGAAKLVAPRSLRYLGDLPCVVLRGSAANFSARLFITPGMRRKPNLPSDPERRSGAARLRRIRHLAR